MVTVASDIPLAALTLRQNDNPSLGFPQDVPTLTTFPVISGRADSSLQAALAQGKTLSYRK